MPTDQERAALEELEQELAALPEDTDAETLQTLLYDIGKKHKFEPLKDWFSALYQILLGQKTGPRFGSFIALYGIENTVQRIRDALSGTLKI